MNTILKSLAAIVAVAAVAAGATFAYFSDTETSEGNTFTAGSLDLELGETTTLPIDVSDAVPGQNNNEIVTLTNTGSIPGKLSMNWTKTIDEENEMLAPETVKYPRSDGKPGTTTGDYNGNGGELDIFLQFAPFVDVDGDGVFNAGDIQLAYRGQSMTFPGYRGGELYFSGLNSYLTTWNDIMTLDKGESVNIIIPWKFPTESPDNNYHVNMAQTDSLGFDVDFTLNQVR